MKIARILYPVKVLGPGERVAIWTSGCPHGCIGCANPELWQAKSEQELPFEIIKHMIESIEENHIIDGFTITGGEPMNQSVALQELVSFLLTITNDILIYSGYTKEQLIDMNSPSINYILQHAAVFIDGKYDQQSNFGHPLKGSENQKIYYLNHEYEEQYQTYILSNLGKAQVQNFAVKGGVISVGIHKSDFNQSLDKILNEKYHIKLEGEQHE